MIRTRTTSPLCWMVGHTEDRNTSPERFCKATVPGAVQLDIAKDLGYPDHTVSDNYKMMTWMEDRYFVYRSEFDTPVLEEGEQLWFVSKGIDYQFDIRLNGTTVYQQEGMFKPVEIDLSGIIRAHNVLEVLIYPAPKVHNESQDRTQAVMCAKPPVSYGWDWHPRLIPSGIWDQTGLQVRKAAHLRTAQVRYDLEADFSCAHVRAEYNGTAECGGCSIRWELFSAEGEKLFCIERPFGENLEADIQAPQLWWTHDHGTPYLYESRLSLVAEEGGIIETTSEKVGFRRVRLVMNEGAWAEPAGFPKSRSNAPIQIELNGRKIFAKGSNWVCPDIFPGKVDDGIYAQLVDMAVETNFNLLRAWGGCSVSKDFFFEYCDKVGMLVWQEFPLACNPYPDDPHYLAVLRQEAEALVKRLRSHPCIVMWCGGNELFNSWSGMTDQSLPLRMLNSICYENCPEIPFIATSPLNGMGHGHYVFYWEGEDVFQRMNTAHMTAYTEFGLPGISPREVLEKIIPAEDLFPPRQGTSWETHHAFGAWDGAKDTWISTSIMNRYFRPAESLDELIEISSLMQGEGYKAIYEESRRQKPYCSMALNWMFCEPWPSAANNSLIVYPAFKKPALEDVRMACRPVCSSLRFERFDWKEGQMFECELWMLNDTAGCIDRQEVKVYVEAEGQSEEILVWSSARSGENANVKGPVARFLLPKWDTDRFTVTTRVSGHPEMDSRYTLAYKQKKVRTGAVTAMNMDVES